MVDRLLTSEHTIVASTELASQPEICKVFSSYQWNASFYYELVLNAPLEWQYKQTF
jgi:hypothetical protein